MSSPPWAMEVRLASIDFSCHQPHGNRVPALVWEFGQSLQVWRLYPS